MCNLYYGPRPNFSESKIAAINTFKKFHTTIFSMVVQSIISKNVQVYKSPQIVNERQQPIHVKADYCQNLLLILFCIYQRHQSLKSINYRLQWHQLYYKIFRMKLIQSLLMISSTNIADRAMVITPARRHRRQKCSRRRRRAKRDGAPPPLKLRRLESLMLSRSMDQGILKISGL